MKRLSAGALALLFAVGLGAGCKKDEPAPAPSGGAPAAKGPAPAAPQPSGTPAAGADAGTGSVATPPVAAATGPVATVNGKPIPPDEYNAELQKVTKTGAEIPEDRLQRIKENILKRLIEGELVRQAVEKEAITVPPEEVDVAFKEYRDRFKNDEQFQNYLKHGNITEQSIKDRILDKRALEKLIEKKGNLTITEAEAREFYDKNQRFYREREGVKASHILIKLEQNATPEQEKEALTKAQALSARIKGGESFEDLAKVESQGPSADKGGDLGFFSKGQMVQPFEEVAFKLKIGEVSEPVRTRFGFHIIKVYERREDKQKTFDEVRPQIEESLKNKKFFQERRRLLEELRAEAKIEKSVE